MPSGERMWSNDDVDLLAADNCLPIIAPCQITNILSTLDPSPEPPSTQLVLIAPNETSDQPPPAPIPQHQNNYVVLKENGATNTLNKKSLKSTNNFEDMLYFVCNLCPFLCTEKVKITDHLENAHKNKTIRKLAHLKCPACNNFFFHKISLRSHLIHDHGVGNSDINQIIQAIVYNANRAKNKAEKSEKGDKIKGIVSNGAIYMIKADEEQKTINAVANNNEEGSDAIVDLPKVFVMQSNAEKIFNNMMNETPNSVSKLIGAKNAQKCALATCKITLKCPEKMAYHSNCHKDAGFLCLTCGEAFTAWKTLASHLWRLHQIDMELFSCDRCDYKSVSLAKLNNVHKLIHGDAKAFVCPECTKAFKNSKQLSNHKFTHKNSTEHLKYTCDVCSKMFRDRRQLRHHSSVVHDKIKPFLCSYCGYKGSSRSSLKMHIRQHTGWLHCLLKRIQKNHTNKNKLVEKYLLPTKNSSEKCYYINYVFFIEQVLGQFWNFSLREKPFSCESCSYKTSDHNSLRRHKLRHTGQKPYKCSYCSYACIQSSTYKTHLKTKHPGQENEHMFTCPECQFRSVNKEMFVAHLISAHEQRPQ